MDEEDSQGLAAVNGGIDDLVDDSESEGVLALLLLAQFVAVAIAVRRSVSDSAPADGAPTSSPGGGLGSKHSRPVHPLALSSPARSSAAHQSMPAFPSIPTTTTASSSASSPSGKKPKGSSSRKKSDDATSSSSSSKNGGGSLGKRSVSATIKSGSDGSLQVINATTDGSGSIHASLSMSPRGSRGIEDWKVRALQAEDRVSFLESELARWKKKATVASAQLGFLASEGSGTFPSINRRGSSASPEGTPRGDRYGNVYEFWEESPGHLTWDETETPRVIKAASLIKLVEYITHPTIVDRRCLEAFFITYRSFTTPRILIEKLILRYAAPPPKNAKPEDIEKFNKTEQAFIRTRVCNALKHWVEKHDHDFEDIDLRDRFEAFMQEMVEEKNLREMLARSLEKAVERLTARLDKIRITDEIRASQKRQEVLAETLRSFEEADQATNSREEAPPKPLLPKNYKSPLHYLLDWPAVEIARQLTLIEFDLFQRIQAKEFLNQCWNKEGKEEKAPGICALIERFNEVGQFFVTLLVQLEELEDRKAMLKKLIQVAEECLHIHNFNALMALVSGLSSTSVSRLTKTWEALGSKQNLFNSLQAITVPEKNFTVLRDRMSTSAPPKIPYIGTSLADLTFIEDGNPDYHDGLINFTKRHLLFVVINNIQTYQKHKYSFTVVPALRNYLLTHPMLSLDQCYALSLLREPRKGSALGAGGGTPTKSSRLSMLGRKSGSSRGLLQTSEQQPSGT
ncbi:RasGEF domain containing protein [Acanthamoeba castellanii str. Neff]|uniref:RasGEF domain containing protein n=1 Tax=Acanthamoeba castellanii (strain ATCC 30010 / Neff) TaxID=1257118 RepID=L8HJG7_ACACF|nr:RasGEF domain containing protein [Acanthamoeba castellanii str. Neff]ELR24833.1 RasGEF domain containing protein [Acanthamoeba castellanii str. Neff]